eukprot:3504744-Prymnesium_polylepis.1
MVTCIHVANTRGRDAASGHIRWASTSFAGCVQGRRLRSCLAITTKSPPFFGCDLDVKCAPPREREMLRLVSAPGDGA